MGGKKVWVCTYCTSENSEELLVCEFCEAQRANGDAKTDCSSSGLAGHPEEKAIVQKTSLGQVCGEFVQNEGYEKQKKSHEEATKKTHAL